MSAVSDFGVLNKALEWTRAGKDVVVATVIQAWGSAPRKPGAHMAITTKRIFWGSVSGGCIEGNIISAAQDILLGGKARLMDFGVSNEQAWKVGLTCGGQITIWLEQIPKEVLECVCAAIDKRERCGMYLSLTEDIPASFVGDGSIQQAEKRLTSIGYIRVYPPKRRIFITGAVHIAQALINLLKLLPFEVVLIDPRSIFLHPKRWGDIKRVELYPDEYFATQSLNERDAVVALSHDPKIDDPALLYALKTSVFYIGALGSRKSHAARVQRLHEKGCTSEQVARIHGPIGLDISAQTPVEIAVAITAEIIAHQGSTR